MGEGHGQLGPQARRDSHPLLWARPCLGVLPDEVRGWCAWPSFVICTCGKPQSGSLQLVKTQRPPLTHPRSTPLVPDPSLLQEHLTTLPTPPQLARVTPLPSRQLPCNPVASNKHKLRMTWGRGGPGLFQPSVLNCLIQLGVATPTWHWARARCPQKPRGESPISSVQTSAALPQVKSRGSDSSDRAG